MIVNIPLWSVELVWAERNVVVWRKHHAELLVAREGLLFVWELGFLRVMQNRYTPAFLRFEELLIK